MRSALVTGTAVVSLSDLKIWLGDDPAITTYDTLYTALLSYGANMLRDWLNWDYSPGVTHQEIWVGNNTTYKILHASYQSDISGATLTSTDLQSGIVSTLPNANYYISGERLNILRSLDFTKFNDRNEYSFMSVSAAAAVNSLTMNTWPPEICQILKEIVQIAFRDSQNLAGTLGETGTLNTLQQKTQIAFRSLLPEWQTRLSTLKRMPI